MTALMFPYVGAITIDVDGTIFVQMALFLFTLVMLNFVLIRPYLKTREMRSENVEGSEEEAGEMQAQSAVLETTYDQKIRKARVDAQEVRESLRNQGLAEQDDIVQEVRTELEAKLEEERKQIESRVAIARAEIESRASSLADTMVNRLMPER